MKVKIRMSEGCVCYSYTLNDIEYTDLTDAESEHFNIEFINKVFEKLVDEITNQYSIPPFMVSYLYDGDWYDGPLADLLCTQDTFINLVKTNKNCREECLGTCDECGDTIYEYKLNIEINDQKKVEIFSTFFILIHKINHNVLYVYVTIITTNKTIKLYDYF